MFHSQKIAGGTCWPLNNLQCLILRRQQQQQNAHTEKSQAQLLSLQYRASIGRNPDVHDPRIEATPPEPCEQRPRRERKAAAAAATRAPLKSKPRLSIEKTQQAGTREHTSNIPYQVFPPCSAHSSVEHPAVLQRVVAGERSSSARGALFAAQASSPPASRSLSPDA